MSTSAQNLLRAHLHGGSNHHGTIIIVVVIIIILKCTNYIWHSLVVQHVIMHLLVVEKKKFPQRFCRFCRDLGPLPLLPSKIRVLPFVSFPCGRHNPDVSLLLPAPGWGNLTPLSRAEAGGIGSSQAFSLTNVLRICNFLIF